MPDEGRGGADHNNLRRYYWELRDKNHIPRGDNLSRFAQVEQLPRLIANLETALENKTADHAAAELPAIPTDIVVRVEDVTGRYTELEDKVLEVADAIEGADNEDGTFDENDVERLVEPDDRAPDTDDDTEHPEGDALEGLPGGQASPPEGKGAWTVAENALEEALGRQPTDNEIWLYWQELMDINDLEVDQILYTSTVLNLPRIDEVEGLEHLVESSNLEEDSDDSGSTDNPDTEVTSTPDMVPEGPPGPDGTIMGMELPADDPRNTGPGTGDGNLTLPSGSEPPDGGDVITPANIMWAGQQTEMTAELRHWLLQQTSSNFLSADTKVWLADILGSDREIVFGGQPIWNDESISYSHLLQAITRDQRPATFTAG